MRRLGIGLLLICLAASTAHGAPILRITEWPYHGANEIEFSETANVGDAPTSLVVYSFSDNAQVPGESSIIRERDAASFLLGWSVATVSSSPQNLGHADEINLDDSLGALVARLTYKTMALGSGREP